MIAATSSTQALWYLTRGTGFVSLVLLTTSVVLGITQVTRWTSPRFPRFVTASLHKSVSLLVMVFLFLHVATAIADGFAPIGWLDVVIPFHSPYRPLWLGLGAVAFDLLAALIISSLLRDRIGYRAWRLIHWAAYACWPVAFLHGLGTGSDSRVGWSLILSLGCLSAVLVAVWWRLASARGVAAAPRAYAAVASAVIFTVIVGWTFTGPVQPGWASRAGTPASMLARRVASTVVPAPLAVPFDARLDGTIRRVAIAGNRAEVSIGASLSGGAAGTVHVVLDGIALDDGGVQMDHSVATLGTRARPNLFQGSIIALDGSRIRARVRDGAGHALVLAMLVNVEGSGRTLTGILSARTASA
jgi:hypothetical protein